MSHVSKKHKRRVKQAVAQDNPPPCHITLLPFELIAEVLMYTNSPQDVLSLCRASKFFCRTLLSSPAEYIWRHARAHALPASLPERPQYLTESAYAALVYDPGNCEVCGRAVSRYTSFALRLYLCKNPKCIEEMNGRITFVEALSHLAIVPRLPEWQLNIINSCIVAESSDIFVVHESKKTFTSWPDGKRPIRTVDWDRAIESHIVSSAQPSASAANARNLARMARKTAVMMPFYCSIRSWALGHSVLYEENSNINERFVKKLAQQRELNYWDFTNAKTVALMKRTYNRSIQSIVVKDIDKHMDVIREEMDALARRRANRRAEANYAKAREEVSAHHSRMLMQPSNLPLPTLPVFRKLPFIATLQTNYDQLDVEKELKTQMASLMIQSNLKEWRKMVKEHLLGVLGLDATKVVEKEMHPVERVNARFLCMQCSHLEAKYQSARGFDWNGVCAHQCPLIGKKKPKEWQLHTFAKDEKAVCVINKVLDLANIDAASSTAHADFVAIGARILCKSCPGVIVLSSTQLVGHSHRHESMGVEFLEKAETDLILRYPLTTGLAVKLLNLHEKWLNQFRDMRAYGCRHCLQRRGADDWNVGGMSLETVPVDADGEGAASTDTNQQPALTWNGIRSHLSAWHKIKDVRDEDFYTTEELVLKKPPKAPLQKTTSVDSSI